MSSVIISIGKYPTIYNAKSICLIALKFNLYIGLKIRSILLSVTGKAANAPFSGIYLL